MELPDGTVLQNSSRVSSVHRFDLAAPQKAIVQEVFYVDDDDNPGLDSVRAKVEIISEDRQVRIPPVRIAYGRQGIENCQEWNPRQTKSKVDGTPFIKDTISDPITGERVIVEKTEPELMDGDIVIVQFMNKNIYDGYITGYISHGAESCGKRAATKEDGDRYLFQHQGMRIKIDKEGNYLLENFQSKLPEFKQIDNQKRKITLQNFDSEGKGLKVEMDGLLNTLKLSRNGEKESSILFDDQQIKIDRAGDSVEIKEKEVTVTESGGGIMKMKDGKIKYGGTSDELLDLLSQTLDKLSKTTAAGFGAPINTVADFAALKAKVDAIKL